MPPSKPLTAYEAVSRALSISLDIKLALKRTYDDFTFKQMWRDRQRTKALAKQNFDAVRHTKLGPDLACSRFVLGYCGGRIRDLKGRWIERKDDLPPDYSRNFAVTAIQAGCPALRTEGIDHFVGLDHLETLNLSRCPQLDDFACDILARQFRQSKSLVEIDLSQNPRITINGLNVLFRIPSLKRLIAIGTRASSDPQLDLFTLAALDERQCKVFALEEGRQFISPDLEELRSDPVESPSN